MTDYHSIAQALVELGERDRTLSPIINKIMEGFSRSNPSLGFSGPNSDPKFVSYSLGHNLRYFHGSDTSTAYQAMTVKSQLRTLTFPLDSLNQSIYKMYFQFRGFEEELDFWGPFELENITCRIHFLRATYSFKPKLEMMIKRLFENRPKIEKFFSLDEQEYENYARHEYPRAAAAKQEELRRLSIPFEKTPWRV